MQADIWYQQSNFNNTVFEFPETKIKIDKVLALLAVGFKRRLEVCNPERIVKSQGSG